LSGTTTKVRPLAADDLPEVARIHIDAFGTDGRTPSDVERAYVEIFPKLYPVDEETQCGEGPTSPSLVLDGGDRLEGFVCVGRRAFTLEGSRRWAAVTSQLAVTESARGSLGAIKLLRAVFDGHQDLTLADRSNPAGRKTLKAAGAEQFPAYSIRWEKVLAPNRLLASRVIGKLPSSPAPVGSLMASLVAPGVEAASQRSGDRLGRRLLVRGHDTIPEPPSTLRSVDLTVDDLVVNGPSVLAAGGIELGPDLGDAELVACDWRRIDDARPNGPTIRTGVTTKRGRFVGWYIVHLADSGRAEVVQFAALPEAQPGVLACLFRDIAAKGAITVRGDLSPQVAFDLSDLGCSLRTGHAALSVQSPHDEILDTFRRGSAFVSGVEGEYLLDPIAAVTPSAINGS
jgi:hypothetical protein